MTDEEEYTTPYVPLGDEHYKRQITMSRFAYHKQIQHKYALKMQLFGISEADAAEEYRKSMENYDQILGLAVTEPGRIDACLEDLAKGFVIPRGGE